VAALFALVASISLIYVALTVTTTRLYLQEVNQKLNQTLAASIVAETPLLQGGAVNQAAFEGLFHSLMVINPSIELYLIDPQGAILSYNAPPGRVRRDRVSLAPIRAFIEATEAFPIRGDDPRDPQGRKVFSAAPVHEGPRLAGYLYVVLGGEAFDSVAEMIQDSYILRLALGVGVASLALALIAGLLSFNWLTRRLRRLGAAVEAFKRGEFQAAMNLGPWRRGPGGDEIDELGVTAEQMSQRIVDQIRQLRHADATRRELIANISHDLRTPLTSLQGYLETLLIKEGELSEAERRHYLDLAAKHGKRLSQLTLAMLESQGPELHFEPFSLAELVQDVAQKFELEAEKHALKLETEIPAGAPFVSGDIALIERVLENLIENAIKYTPKAASGSPWCPGPGASRPGSPIPGSASRSTRSRTSSSASTGSRSRAAKGPRAPAWASPSRAASSTSTAARSPSRASPATARRSPSSSRPPPERRAQGCGCCHASLAQS
jgi:signal transduction histidine kinase